MADAGQRMCDGGNETDWRERVKPLGEIEMRRCLSVIPFLSATVVNVETVTGSAKMF